MPRTVRVTVMLKDGVLDPQGQAVSHALVSLGFEGVRSVRQGKLLELEVADGVSNEDIGRMCEGLLANTVIERYSIEG